MKTNQQKLKIDDNIQLHLLECLPENEHDIKGVVQIAHGMAEHSGRYIDFASFLTQNGFAVYANDHRGHGKTAKDIFNLGFFAEQNGWDKVVHDLKAVTLYINKKYPNKPIVLFGHSMGSFLMRTYIMNPPLNIAGVVLSGTAGDPGLLGKLGLLVTNFIMLFNKKNSKSHLMNKLSFGTYNKSFKPNRTEFDWLSRDNKEVDKYINDKYCGYVFTIKAFNDLLLGILYLNKQSNINKTNSNLPICLISGDKDPVGNNGKGVKEVYNKFKKAGVKNLTIKLFENGRHEMLNETNKIEVYNFILEWINKLI